MRYLAVVFSLLMFSICSAANHSFTGLPLEANGWTDFETLTGTGYSTARVVFVSNSGSDGTGSVYDTTDIDFDSYGNFIAVGSINAYSTIATAYAELRDGYPDILLLERGSGWTAGLTGYTHGGSAQTTPHIIAPYGTGVRPKLTDVALSTRDADYLLVAGIHFYSADWTTATRGVDTRGDADYQTFEDLLFEETAGGIIQGQDANYCDYIAYRRCVWTHNEAHDGQLFAQQANYVLVEQSIFHEPYDGTYTDESQFGRFFYFTSESTSSPDNHDYLNNVTFRSNIFYHSERGGADLRSGGTFDGNVVVATDTNVFGGYGGSKGTIQSVTITNNSFLEGPPTVTGYNNVWLRNIDGGTIISNLFTDNTNVGTYGSAITILGDDEGVWISRNITISENVIYGRGTEVLFSTVADLTDIQNIEVTDNEFNSASGRIITSNTWGAGAYRFEGFTYTGNSYYSAGSTSNWFSPGGTYEGWVTASGETGSSSGAVSYTDSSRTIKTYNQTLGGTASTFEFMAGAAALSRTNWDTDYTAAAVNDYLRAGFDLDEYVPPTGHLSLGTGTCNGCTFK